MLGPSAECSGDDAVQATNDDAVAGKRCAVQLGYWKDPYLQFFCRNTERKAPEMNRGYYARTQVIKSLILRASKITGNRCQIVSLGAGFDTLYWRLKDEGVTVANFTEVDFLPVTAKKCYCIKKSKELLQGLATSEGEIRMSSSELHATNYHLVAADIRNLDELRQKLKESEIDTNVPTLFIAECVLVYVEPQQSNVILRWIADNFPSCVFVIYEQVNMMDKFGSVMVENLKARGCVLAGVEACASLTSQENRFTSVGWETANALNMVQVYNTLPTEEIQRIEKIEFLDERELMEQLFLHYCVCIATKDEQQLGLAKVNL